MIHTLPKSLIEAATQHITHIDVDGEMKHKYNSEGNHIHHTDEGIQNFHRWFGKSHAVDSAGRPKVMYHGTDAKFDTFKPQEGTVSTILGTEKVKRNGHFFTADKDFAKEYSTKGTVMPVYLKMHKPFDMTHGISHDTYDKVESHGFNGKWLLSSHLDDWERFDGEDGTAFTDLLKHKMGHDSAMINEPSAKGSRVAHIVFDPTQIKSTNNGGNFHPNKESIND